MIIITARLWLSFCLSPSRPRYFRGARADQSRPFFHRCFAARFPALSDYTELVSLRDWAPRGELVRLSLIRRKTVRHSRERTQPPKLIGRHRGGGIMIHCPRGQARRGCKGRRKSGISTMTAFSSSLGWKLGYALCATWRLSIKFARVSQPRIWENVIDVRRETEMGD